MVVQISLQQKKLNFEFAHVKQNKTVNDKKNIDHNLIY